MPLQTQHKNSLNLARPSVCYARRSEIHGSKIAALPEHAHSDRVQSLHQMFSIQGWPAWKPPSLSTARDHCVHIDLARDDSAFYKHTSADHNRFGIDSCCIEVNLNVPGSVRENEFVRVACSFYNGPLENHLTPDPALQDVLDRNYERRGERWSWVRWWRWYGHDCEHARNGSPTGRSDPKDIIGVAVCVRVAQHDGAAVTEE